MIRLATTFSGIGAIEQAFIKMGLHHKIVFACDNGERNPNCDVEVIKDVLKSTIGENRTSLFFNQFSDKAVTFVDLSESLRRLPEKELRKFEQAWYDRLNKPNNQKQSYFANYAISEDCWYEDIRLLNGNKYNKKVDLFVGGSPCQAFSSNGKRGGLKDARGTLFYEYCRLISEIQPRAFLFENVQGLLIHDKSHTWQIVKNCFNCLGYSIYINKDELGNEQPLLDAQNYGIPQRRRRVFLIGIRKDCDTKQFVFPQKIPLTSTVKDFLEPHAQVDSKYYLKEKGFTFVTTHPTRARIAGDVMGCQKANQQFNWNGDFIFVPLKEISHVPAIVANAHIGKFKNEIGVIRKFTPRECLRLMGFPDTYKIVHNDTQTYRECGNSIVVNVLQSLIDQLIRCQAIIN